MAILWVQTVDFSNLVVALVDQGMAVVLTLMEDWIQVWVEFQTGSSLWVVRMICIHNFLSLLEALADKDEEDLDSTPTTHLVEDLDQAVAVAASVEAVAASAEAVVTFTIENIKKLYY